MTAYLALPPPPKLNTAVTSRRGRVPGDRKASRASVWMPPFNDTARSIVGRVNIALLPLD
ncbi:hypothetical protein CVT26_009722 [Gymnopilus dilepis]|uniref:Uncharacterized protein n=1 Tax=Gymnopilus dilepis TaxID=231916 RepID=A0A409YBH2_9AGAR|nr:hypothetical protein CVT26_009722 [Gymnopilus dilepis]